MTIELSEINTRVAHTEEWGGGNILICKKYNSAQVEDLRATHVIVHDSLEGIKVYPTLLALFSGDENNVLEISDIDHLNTYLHGR